MNTDFKEPQNKVTPALPHFNNAARLNLWLFENVRPYIQGRMMEMNSGYGSFSSLLIENKMAVHLNELNDHYREVLSNKFSNTTLVRKIHKVDFHHQDFEKVNSNKIGIFNAIFALNIIDHTCIDSMSISNAKKLLCENGHLIVMTPAATALYDESLQSSQDLKEYNWDSLNKLLGANFEFMKARYFKLVGEENSATFRQTGLFVVVVGRKIH